MRGGPIVATMALDDYPGVSSYRDRHGKTRFRYRARGRTVSLPGEPGEPLFEHAYQAAFAGRKPDKADVALFNGGVAPRSFAHAWQLVQKDAEWHGLAPTTQKKNRTLIETFLESPVAEGADMKWRVALVADLRRRHLKQILSAHAATPHKAKHMVTAIRRLIEMALDQEWIETDPSHKLKWRPAYVGWRAWRMAEMRAYLERWPAGTTPHLVFCLALWLGNRRGDIATLRWDQRSTRKLRVAGELRIVRGFDVRQGKTGRRLFLPETPMLAAALHATPRRGETVLVTEYGNPFSPKSLTGRMADWTRSAALEKGCTLHGLRKTLGKALAEGGATTRQLMDILGHDDIEHAELYSREAEQAILAIEGMDRVAGFLDD